MGWDSPTAREASVFTANASSQLQAVATYALSNSTTYPIDIYTNASSGPISGTLAATTSGTMSVAGDNTIVLPSPVPITQGQKFPVVAELTSPGNNYPLSVSLAMNGYSGQATSSPGTSVRLQAE